ncbi:MAG: aldo/keto reductase [Lachnospiraceae bacterium]
MNHKTIRLNNSVEMPMLGLGVWQSEFGKATEDAVKWALEAGYRHIDTAMIYQNEESVGKGIKESKVAREEIFLTTKLWNDDVRAGNTLQAFERSLQRLAVDYVDMYLIHWPVDGFTEAWRVMEDLYQQGKIKAIGVSNFHQTHLEKLNSEAKVVPAINQIESHPMFHNQKLIDYCQGKGIAVSAWSPLGGSQGNLLKDERLLKMADKYNKTTAQIILRWDIQREIVVIPKSVHKERIISNMKIFDFELSQEDMDTINSLNQDKRTGADPDNFDF